MLCSFNRVILPICSLVVISGCGADIFTNNNLNIFGTEPVVKKERFQKVDLALLLRPNFDVKKSQAAADSLQENRWFLESGFREFNVAYTSNSRTGMRHRNSVQHRIMAASDQRCGEYKKFLKAMDSRTNLVLGSLTTAIAGAGAIFTNANTVRALSGIAGIFSGVRAEFNQNYFANRTTQVLTDAFYKRRASIRKSILRKNKKSLFDYPVERAIADAVRYHENCSLVAGLEVAALAVLRVDDPGVIQLLKFQKHTRSLVHGANITDAARKESSAADEAVAAETAVAKAEQDVREAEGELKIADAGAKAAAQDKLDGVNKILDAAKIEQQKAKARLAKKKAETARLKKSVPKDDLQQEADISDAVEQMEQAALKESADAAALRSLLQRIEAVRKKIESLNDEKAIEFAVTPPIEDAGVEKNIIGREDPENKRS